MDRHRKENTLPLVVIAGATATGKSDMALDIAERCGGEIINADALQQYRGMDIGTAKVPQRDRRGIPHHLFDTLSVRDEASVAEYQTAARELVRKIRNRGRIPLAVGGSGLYLRALTDQIRFPPSAPQLRAELENWVDEVGSEAAHRQLMHTDPEAAQKIGPGDSRRIIRALEVGKITGLPFAAFLPTYTYADPHIVYVAVERPRSELHERVEQRVMRMIDQGLVAEVEQLISQGIKDGKTARQAIGYAQVIDYLEGRLSLKEAIDSTIVGTRKLVRKQDTWFRRDPRITWLSGRAHAESVSWIMQKILNA